jgi:diacylglycerol kinase (ATP)
MAAMRRVALLLNPESGTGEAAAVERDLRTLEADVTVFPIQDPDLVLEAEPERIVVAGGDGSIGPAAELAARTGVPLAVVPVGTANDFARAFDLPRARSDAYRLAVEGERTRPIELGRMGERPFVNVASLGLAPAAARRAPRGLKRRLGTVSYVVGAIRAGLTATPVACRIVANDGEELFSGEAWQATIACSGAFGAGSRVAADPADFMLDAVVIEVGSRVSLVVRAYGMRAGSLERQAGVHSRRARAFDVEVGRDTAFNVDGEICVRSGRVPLRVEPAPVELVVG